MGALLGIIFFLTGYGYYPLIIGIACGLIADLIMKAGRYKSWKTMLLGYVVFSQWAVGTQVMMFLMGDACVEMYRASQGDSFANGLASLIEGYMFPVIIAGVAMGAVIGAFIGRAVLNKHFKRARIA